MLRSLSFTYKSGKCVCSFLLHTPLHLSEHSLGRQIYLPVPLTHFTLSGRDYVPVYFSIFYFLATNSFSWGIQYIQRATLLILPFPQCRDFVFVFSFFYRSATFHIFPVIALNTCLSLDPSRCTFFDINYGQKREKV